MGVRTQDPAYLVGPRSRLDVRPKIRLWLSPRIGTTRYVSGYQTTIVALILGWKVPEWSNVRGVAKV
jgi:hypothetical protein